MKRKVVNPDPQVRKSHKIEKKILDREMEEQLIKEEEKMKEKSKKSKE
jgi:hypothetical protein